MTFRPIPDVRLGREHLKPPAGKQPAGVIWLDPSKLSIDQRYQRELGTRGVHRVRAIALGFDWRKFTPIIVARRSADLAEGYAVIDGQHRVAAALARGDIKLVPAWAIDADLAGQAQAFLAINAEGARVPAGAMWYARAACGDQEAQALLDVCAEARVQIMKSPVDNAHRRFDQTLAGGALHQLLKTHGKTVVLKALAVLRAAGELSGRSLLTRNFIRAAGLLVKHNPQWSDARKVAIALSDIKMEEVEARAELAASKDGGTRVEHVLALVREHVAQRMGALAA